MFKPIFKITRSLASTLIKIESLKQQISTLPITPRVLSNLRESSRLQSTHYSTKIEGNRLTQEQVNGLLKRGEHFEKRERDVKEVLGYFAALAKVELVEGHTSFSENSIKLIRALIMGDGKKKVSPTHIAMAKI